MSRNRDDGVTPFGTWVAYHGDGSAFVPFATELQALRYAQQHSMQVKFVRFGDADWQHTEPTP